MSDDQQKPRFEPPPWEREAFDRFRAEQDEQRKQAELDAALLEMQRPPVPTDATPAEERPASSPSGAEAGAVAGQGAPAAPPVGEAALEAGAAQPAPPAISEARIDSMLIQLKGEEPPPVRTNIALVNTVIACFVIAGIWIIVEAALLFSGTRASGAAGMLGAVASLIVLLTGLGFLAGGFLLFRKHHL